jgi:hypothetical protein
MGDVLRLVFALGVIAVGFLLFGPMTSAEPAKAIPMSDMLAARETYSVASNSTGETTGYFFDEEGGHGFVNRADTSHVFEFPGATPPTRSRLMMPARSSDTTSTVRAAMASGSTGACLRGSPTLVPSPPGH